MCVLNVEGISCLKEVLSFLLPESPCDNHFLMPSARLPKRLEDVKKIVFLLKNVGLTSKKRAQNEKKLLSLHLN